MFKDAGWRWALAVAALTGCAEAGPETAPGAGGTIADETFAPGVEVAASDLTLAEFGVARWVWGRDLSAEDTGRVLGVSVQGQLVVDARLVLQGDLDRPAFDVELARPGPGRLSLERTDGGWQSPAGSPLEPIAAAMLHDNETAFAREAEALREGDSRPKFLEFLIAWAIGEAQRGEAPPPAGTLKVAVHCFGFTGLCGYFPFDTTVGLASCEHTGQLYACACVGFAADQRPPGCVGGTGSATAIGALSAATDWCSHEGATLHQGDFNGDGRTDLMCRDAGRLWLDYGDAARGTPGETDWYVDTAFCTHSGAALHMADVNGDGRTDLVCKDAQNMWIDYASSQGRFGSHDWFSETRFCTHAGARLHVADVDGDRRADLVCRDTSGRIWIDLAASPGFTGHDWFSDSRFCSHAGATLHVGDVNGDRRADLVCHDRQGATWIDYADANGRYLGHDFFVDVNYCTHTGAQTHLGDLNGDGRADLACHDAQNRLWIDYADAAGRFGQHDVFYGGH